MPFAAQSHPQAFLHGIGGNRTVMNVDRRVLVDLLGRDGAFGDSSTTLVDKILHLLGRSIWLDDTKTAPLRFALSISKIRHRSVQRPDVDGCFLLHRWRPPLVVHPNADLCGITRQLCDALLWTEAADISLNLTDSDATIAACPKETLWLDQAHAKVMRSTLRSVKCRAAKVP